MQLIPFFAAIAIIGGVIYLGYYLKKKRTEAMQRVAITMGFQFEEGDVRDTSERYGALPLFERGHSRRARNIMTGQLAGEPAMVFDYQYRTGGGKQSHTYEQTVALFPTRGRHLPDFELGPENLLHRLGQVFGYQDIDFEQFPEFSKQYLLRGEDEAAIRTAFTSTVIAGLEQTPDWSLQSRGDTLLAFYDDRKCKPEETPAFLADALRIVSGFTVKA